MASKVKGSLCKLHVHVSVACVKLHANEEQTLYTLESYAQIIPFVQL